MNQSFTTERLMMEPVRIEDAEFIIELVNTEGWLQFIGDRHVHSKEAAVIYIEKLRSTPALTYWVVRLRDDKLPLGIISFLKRANLEHFDIGFAFLPQYQGQGYAYEAARKVLSVVSEHPEHHTILATTLANNTSSIRLLERLGFGLDREMQEGDKRILIFSNARNGS